MSAPFGGFRPGEEGFEPELFDEQHDGGLTWAIIALFLAIAMAGAVLAWRAFDRPDPLGLRPTITPRPASWVPAPRSTEREFASLTVYGSERP